MFSLCLRFMMIFYFENYPLTQVIQKTVQNFSSLSSLRNPQSPLRWASTSPSFSGLYPCSLPHLTLKSPHYFQSFIAHNGLPASQFHLKGGEKNVLILQFPQHITATETINFSIASVNETRTSVCYTNFNFQNLPLRKRVGRKGLKLCSATLYYVSFPVKKVCCCINL